MWLLYLVLFVVILFIYLFFGCAESSLLCGLFSSCVEQGLISSCGARVSHCSGFSFRGVQALELTGFSSSSTWAHWLQFPMFYNIGLTVAVHGLSCLEACETFSSQESNLSLLHWQVDSLSLSHQGNPDHSLYIF